MVHSLIIFIALPLLGRIRSKVAGDSISSINVARRDWQVCMLTCIPTCLQVE